MGAAIRVRAPAKINLVLDVGRRGPDGYHDVRTVLQAISLWDRIDLDPANDLDVLCDAPGVDGGPENLAWRAADCLRRAAGVRGGARIRLSKQIPAQAGLGGGSSDAAAALLGCSRLWGLDWPASRLMAVAADLGADVPFFLVGGTALGQGRGDRLRRLPPLPAWPGVVAFALVGSATASAYAALDALGTWRHPSPEPLMAACAESLGPRSRAARSRVAATLGNSFEDVLLTNRPDIAALKRGLETSGALAALVCGSGAAVWALAPSLRWAEWQAGCLRAGGLWARAVRFDPQGVRIEADA